MGWLWNSLVAIIAFVLLPFYLPDPPVIEDVKELPNQLQNWHKLGKLTPINGNKVFYIYKKCTDPKISHPPTFVIIHGFPSSSFEYNKVLVGLLARGDVFVHDHVGFGFSDKPRTNFTYSLTEAADNCLAIWRKLGIKNAHVVAHDMGDSILTEILARRHRNMLPDYFTDFFKSVTFTNGGMKYSLIDFRISQVVLSSRFGGYFSMLNTKLRLTRPFISQLRSVWGASGDQQTKEVDISMIVSMNKYKGGSGIMHKLIYYLWDRAHFEFRWFAALAEIDLPVRLIWSNSDAVSPLSIPRFIQSIVPNARLEIVENVGHFFMLETPEQWLAKILKNI